MAWRDVVVERGGRAAAAEGTAQSTSSRRSPSARPGGACRSRIRAPVSTDDLTDVAARPAWENAASVRSAMRSLPEGRALLSGPAVNSIALAPFWRATAALERSAANGENKRLLIVPVRTVARNGARPSPSRRGPHSRHHRVPSDDAVTSDDDIALPRAPSRRTGGTDGSRSQRPATFFPSPCLRGGSSLPAQIDTVDEDGRGSEPRGRARPLGPRRGRSS